MKKLIWFFIFTMFFIMTSCKIQVPDPKFCAELDLNRGFCKRALSETESFVTGQDWKDLKKHSLIIPNEDVSKIKAFIQKVCRKTDECDFKGYDSLMKALDK